MEPRLGHRSRQSIEEFSPAASGVHLGDCWQWHCSHANWPSPAAHQQVGLESQSTPGSKSSVAATLACKSWAATTQCLRPSPVWRMNSASPRFAVKFPRKWSRLSLWSTWCPPHQLEVMTPTADRADDQPKRKRPRNFAALWELSKRRCCRYCFGGVVPCGFVVGVVVGLVAPTPPGRVPPAPGRLAEGADGTPDCWL